MKILFFFSLFIIFYIYGGYLLLTILISLVKRRPVNVSDIEPSVTIIIPAYNEEDHIEATIRNKLSLDYPHSKIEIIVISDGSTDHTDEIVRQFNRPTVHLIRQEPRAGKTAAIEKAMPHARGEIIVFSDANSIYSTNALKKLIRNFNDPEVGYVTGKMVYTNNDNTTIGESCGAFMAYENILRLFETRIGSIVGVDGGIDAVRKNLYQSMRPDQLPDFVLPMKVIEQGYRVIYEPEAVLKEVALNDAADEYRMRVRVTLRALWALRDMKHLLSPVHFGFYAIQLWSHKVLRYFGFLFLLLAWFSNLLLVFEGSFYTLFFIAQLLAYAMAASSPFLEKRNIRIKFFYLCHYFLILNFSATHAYINFLLGQKKVIWTPRKG